MNHISRKALIATNLAGFMGFILDDIGLLRSLGYTVTVAADNFMDESRLLAEIERRGGKFVNVPCDPSSLFSRSNLRCFLGYRRLLKEGYDAIVCHTPIVGLSIRTAAMMLGPRRPKIIYMSHGFSWNHFSGSLHRIIFRSLEKFGSRFCDAIITINEEDKAEADKMHCRNVYKISGVGCDVRRIRGEAGRREEIRKKLGIRENDILVLSIGTINHNKNHAVVIKAIGTLEDRERYLYVICGREMGGTEQTDRLLKLAEESGVSLKMLGHRNDIPAVVHAADIGALPSRREGLGMAGVETLSAGVPVIGTDVQGIREYVVDGKTGCLIDDPDDAEAFASAIRKLSDPELRGAMRGECMAMAEKFDISVSLAQRKKIFSKIFGEK